MIFVTCPRARGDQDEASKALEDFLSTANDATSSGRRRIAGARLDPWSWYTVKSEGKQNWVVVSIFEFHPENWGNDPFWLIFFRWVETTNQKRNLKMMGVPKVGISFSNGPIFRWTMFNFGGGMWFPGFVVVVVVVLVGVGVGVGVVVVFFFNSGFTHEYHGTEVFVLKVWMS